MEQGDLIWPSAAKRFERLQLVTDELQAQFCIAQRVVSRIGYELIVLDQPVIGVAGKGEGRQLQGVQYRPAQAFELRELLAKQGNIVASNVVPQQYMTLVGKTV